MTGPRVARLDQTRGGGGERAGGRRGRGAHQMGFRDHDVTQLNADVVRILNRPDVREKLREIGMEPVTNSPGAFAACLKSQIAKRAQVMKASGV